LYTPDELNANYDAEITDNLYRADDYYWRICQEAVLGIGGMRMLEARNYKPEVVHVNEGHGAFAPVELANILKNEEEAKARTIFTTHTPVPAGHDVFPAYKVEEVLHKWLNKSLREEMAPTGNLNMTQVALKRSRYVNAVAKRHAEVSAEMDIFKGTTVDYITNGVHSYTWTSPEFQKLFDRKIPEWRNDPANLSKASGLSLSSIIHAHHAAKLNLIEYVRERTDVSLDPDVLTIGFARRFAGYKRADLIFDDPKMLLDAVDGDIQMIFAGKAHPNDGGGKQLIKRIKDIAQNLRKRMNVVFLDNYGMGMSSKLVSGVDIWLNTPERGREASGTSGMKAAHNGVPQISTDDGWWSEANGGGWTIGPLASSNAPLDRVVDAQDLYAKLKKEILPVMLNHTKAAEMSREAIARNASQFNCHRMLKEYVEKAYWPGVKTQLGTPEEDEEQAR
jgi:starch phosphorylase